MAIHFSKQELASRRQRTCEAMGEAKLDGLLIFRQESMFYLTGYDTFGYVFFQCLYLGQDGVMTLLTRSADLRQAQHTSVIGDIRIWVDSPDADPAYAMTGILEEHGQRGARLGIEWESYGLTARNGQRLAVALDGFCVTEDASELVSRLRVIKSPAEIAFVRRAAKLADDAYNEAIHLASPGASEADILAGMQSVVLRGGGDYPGNEFVIGSGRDALLCRYYSGRRTLDASDQLTLEWAGVYRHYHTAMMRTFAIGEPPLRQRALFDVAADALEAVKSVVKPSCTFGEAFDAHAQVLDEAGLGKHRLNACGYSLGTTFAPNWMDWPMLFHGNPVVFEPGMVIFCHMIIFDSEIELAMTLGETVLVSEAGHDRLSRSPLEFVVI